MINLLPDETKQQIRAARTNVFLLKIIISLGCAVIYLAVVCTATYFIISNEKASPTTAAIIKRANTMQTSFNTAQSVIDQQISYSDIITNLASALPTGMILDKLSLNNATLDSPIDIQLHASDEDNVPLLKQNLQKLAQFSNYNLQSVTSDSNAVPGYPIKVDISLTIRSLK
ncbi:MAG: PilN domain-containing protein [Candidatus Saccharibacteria bacterium]